MSMIISCNKKLHVPFQVKIEFSSFYIHGGFRPHFFSIYDGDSSSAPLLLSANGRAIPGPIITSGNQAFIILTSDIHSYPDVRFSTIMTETKHRKYHIN